jgi:hypothetical protein
MGELVLLAPVVIQRNEDAQVVGTWYDAHAGAGKLGAQLVEAARADALFRAVNVKGGDGRVVRRLLGEVGNSDARAVAGNAARLARRRRAWRLEGGVGVFDLPFASEELAERRVVGLARLALDVFLAPISGTLTQPRFSLPSPW